MVEKNYKDANEISDKLLMLALVDKVIGLEAEIARLSIESGVKDIRILQKSRPWKVGRVVLFPAVVVKKLLRK